jgi:hypothetical protein
MDLAWNALDADPAHQCTRGKATHFNAEVTPVKLETQFDIPANDWRPAIKLGWYQGGANLESPAKYIDLKKIDHERCS